MRIAPLIFTGSIAALAVLTAPALAKNSNTQKIDDPSAASASSSSASPKSARLTAKTGGLLNGVGPLFDRIRSNPQSPPIRF